MFEVNGATLSPGAVTEALRTPRSTANEAQNPPSLGKRPPMTKKAAFHSAASETSPPLLCRRLCAKPRQMTFEQLRPRFIVRRCDLRVHGPNNANDRRAYVREYWAVDQRLDQPSQRYQHCRQTQNCH